MTGILQRSRWVAWGGWLILGVLLIGVLFSSFLFRAQVTPQFRPEEVGSGAPIPVTSQVERDVAGSGAFDDGSVAEPGGAQQERLIIRNGSISLEVTDPRGAQAQIEQIVAEMAGEGAFVVSSSEFGGSGEQLPTVNMAIRVPALRFDEAMDRLAALALEVLSRTESGQDVTEEYVDLQARLESLEAARRRLLGLMENAETTEELLLAEQQLTQREAELESIKGRLQFLEQSARLSNITIELRPSILNQPVDVGWRPAETVRRSFERQLERLQDFADFAINFVIVELPWLLVFGLVVLGVVRLAIAWQRRRAKAAPPADPGAS